MQHITPELSARLADMHHQLKQFEVRVSRLMNIAKRETALDVEEAQTISDFLLNLLAIAKLLEQPAKTEPSDLMGLPQDMTTWDAVEASQRIVSIQVQTTKLTGAGVEMVSYKSGEATHWSLYTRNADGITTWVKDIKITKSEAAGHFTEAMVEASKLSIEYQAFIEYVK